MPGGCTTRGAGRATRAGSCCTSCTPGAQPSRLASRAERGTGRRNAGPVGLARASLLLELDPARRAAPGRRLARQRAVGVHQRQPGLREDLREPRPGEVAAGIARVDDQVGEVARTLTGRGEDPAARVARQAEPRPAVAVVEPVGRQAALLLALRDRDAVAVAVVAHDLGPAAGVDAVGAAGRECRIDREARADGDHRVVVAHAVVDELRHRADVGDRLADAWRRHLHVDALADPVDTVPGRADVVLAAVRVDEVGGAAVRVDLTGAGLHGRRRHGLHARADVERAGAFLLDPGRGLALL